MVANDRMNSLCVSAPLKGSFFCLVGFYHSLPENGLPGTLETEGIR